MRQEYYARYAEWYKNSLPKACDTCDPLYRGLNRGFRRSIKKGDFEAAYRLGVAMQRMLREAEADATTP